MANTLLSYFKDNLKAAGENTKYFNRDFLIKYCSAWRAAHQEDAPAIFYERDGVIYNGYYTEVYATDFYSKNSTAYCIFLELWASYKNAMQYLTDLERRPRA